MYVQAFRKVMRVEIVLFLAITLSVHHIAEGKSYYLKPWKDVYQILHPREKPPWRSLGDAQAWVASERGRLEPLVLEVLRGEHPEKTQSEMLFVARVIPTNKIRDVLLLRVQEVVQKEGNNPIQPTSRSSGALAVAVDIFATASDARIVPSLLLLINVDGQAYEILEHCAMALRSVGDEASLKNLRSIALRQRDIRFDRLCALTEKIIEARVAGKIGSSAKSVEAF